MTRDAIFFTFGAFVGGFVGMFAAFGYVMVIG